MRSFLLCLWVLVWASSASAATYYVATTGSNSTCGAAQTIGTPAQTIDFGVACLSASGGDTLYIRGGTYTGASNAIDSTTATVNGGTSWANVNTISGYPSETAIIQPPDGEDGITFYSTSQQYIVVQDLTIDMINSTGCSTGAIGVFVSHGAHHNRFQRLDVKDNSGNGFVFDDNGANSPFNEVLNSLIHGHGRCAGENSGYGIYAYTSDNLFANNEVYNNSGYGIHIYGTSNTTRNVVRANHIYGNGTNGGTNFGIILASGNANLAYNNIIHDNRGGITLRNAGQMAYHNTVYDNTPAQGIQIYPGSTNTEVRNNIVHTNAFADIEDLGSSVTCSHNVTGTAQPGSCANGIVADPLFTNGSGFYNVATDFQLQTGSPAKNAAIALAVVTDDYASLARPEGSASDIGAYEFDEPPEGTPEPSPTFPVRVRVR